jgi:CheY-like chemotaxis protein
MPPKSSHRSRHAEPRVALILAVDDDPGVLALVRANLEIDGYKVVTANDGGEALEMVPRERPDAIVCDLMMPGVGGLTVLRYLRADPATRHIPFVILSAKSMPADIKEALEMGADRYITKPFDPQDLLDAIAELLAERT